MMKHGESVRERVSKFFGKWSWGTRNPGSAESTTSGPSVAERVAQLEGARDDLGQLLASAGVTAASGEGNLNVFTSPHQRTEEGNLSGYTSSVQQLQVQQQLVQQQQQLLLVQQQAGEGYLNVHTSSGQLQQMTLEQQQQLQQMTSEQQQLQQMIPSDPLSTDPSQVPKTPEKDAQGLIINFSLYDGS